MCVSSKLLLYRATTPQSSVEKKVELSALLRACVTITFILFLKIVHRPTCIVGRRIVIRRISSTDGILPSSSFRRPCCR